MQELTAPPQTTAPYTPAGGSNMAAAPRLGTPIPGTTGGLPPISGLSVAQNPMSPSLQSSPQQAAQQTQSYGRGEDSVLVHMTPNEVNSLRGLAQHFGGDLSVNPNTGLPEAGWLGKLLPAILGGVLAATGVGAPLAAGIVGLGQTALTGDLKKGLMAGLGAFGGASLTGAAGLGGAISKNAFGALGSKAGVLGANMGAGAAVAPAGAGIKAAAVDNLLPGDMLAEQLASQGANTAAKTGLAGFGQKFGQAASAGLGGTAAKVAPYLAGAGVLNTVSEATAPNLPRYTPEQTKPYTRMAPLQRQVRYPTVQELNDIGTGEFNYFAPSNPEPVPMSPPTPEERSGYGYAEGGTASSAPPPSEFEALMAAYQNANPGAITASMYPTARAQSGPETMFAFNRGLNTGAKAPPSVPGSGGETTGTPAAVNNSNTMTASNLPGSVSNTQFEINRRDGVYSPDPRGPFVLDPSLPGTKIPGMNVSGQGVMPDFRLDPLRINPVDMSLNDTYLPLSPGTTIPGMNVSGQGVMPDFRLADLYVNPVERPGTITPGVNVSGQGYMPNFRLADLRVNPVDVYKDPEEYEEAKARGGKVNMKNGSFVVDARTVSELGNGSSGAGIEYLASMGGRPVRGGGDGVSDSVPARIGGRQEARVARDEVIFPPEAVRRIGGGNVKRGTQKLYAMMEKAHKARKNAKRGSDTKLRRGLA